MLFLYIRHSGVLLVLNHQTLQVFRIKRCPKKRLYNTLSVCTLKLELKEINFYYFHKLNSTHYESIERISSGKSLIEIQCTFQNKVTQIFDMCRHPSAYFRSQRSGFSSRIHIHTSRYSQPSRAFVCCGSGANLPLLSSLEYTNRTQNLCNEKYHTLNPLLSSFVVGILIKIYMQKPLRLNETVIIDAYYAVLYTYILSRKATSYSTNNNISH